MQALFPLAILFYVVLAFVFTLLYAHYKKSGLEFGVLIGLLLGTIAAMTYNYLPISVLLAVLWFIGSFIQGVGVGLILGWTFKK